MSETKHSPEPWRIGGHLGDDSQLAIVCGDPVEDLVLSFETQDPLTISREDARRAVACVNACAGIPTEALESGALGKALEALAFVASPPGVTRLRDARVEARSALRSLGRLK